MSLIRLTDFGAPKRHASFSPMENSECVVWSERYEKLKTYSDSGGTFVLIGINGGGKTQLSVSLMGYFFYKIEKTVMFIKACELTLRLRESKNGGEKTYFSLVSQFIRPDLLVIDALENIKGSETDSMELNHIIDKRYEYGGKTTLLTTDQTEKATKELLTGSVVNRMSESGGWMVFDGMSFRIKNRGV